MVLKKSIEEEKIKKIAKYIYTIETDRQLCNNNMAVVVTISSLVLDVILGLSSREDPSRPAIGLLLLPLKLTVDFWIYRRTDHKNDRVLYRCGLSLFSFYYYRPGRIPFTFFFSNCVVDV